MTEQSKIIKKISLHPKYLGSELKKYLFEKIKSVYYNKCSQRYGYILKIEPEIQILDNILYSTTTSIVFSVEIVIKHIKPIEGLIIEVKVLQVLNAGILAEMFDVMKIFIPKTNIDKLEFDKNKKSFSDDKVDIINGDKIEIKLIKIRYENSSYICIGNFIRKLK